MKNLEQNKKILLVDNNINKWWKIKRLKKVNFCRKIYFLKNGKN